MKYQLFHNPRCSKSRQTLALLQERGVEALIIDYLNDAPSVEELRAIQSRLGLSSARDMMRTGEAEYKALGLKDISDEAKLLEAMAEHPKLIERPILIHGDRAAIGRPPESVLKIL